MNKNQSYLLVAYGVSISSKAMIARNQANNPKKKKNWKEKRGEQMHKQDFFYFDQIFVWFINLLN